VAPSTPPADGFGRESVFCAPSTPPADFEVFVAWTPATPEDVFVDFVDAPVVFETAVFDEVLVEVDELTLDDVDVLVELSETILTDTTFDDSVELQVAAGTAIVSCTVSYPATWSSACFE
jgi:hypothetical protein